MSHNIQAGRFKAHCLQIMADVNKTKIPEENAVLVTCDNKILDYGLRQFVSVNDPR